MKTYNILALVAAAPAFGTAAIAQGQGGGVIDAEEQVNMASTIAGAMEANHGGNGQGQDQGQGGAHDRGGPGPQIHAAMTAEYADSDSDGMIARAQWDGATARLFGELDRNGDGVLDPRDFGRDG